METCCIRQQPSRSHITRHKFGYFEECRLWWVGPEWLSQNQEQWLNTPLLRHPEPPPEQREVTTVKVMIHCSPAEFITRFSTLSKL